VIQTRYSDGVVTGCGVLQVPGNTRTALSGDHLTTHCTYTTTLRAGGVAFNVTTRTTGILLSRIEPTL